MRQTTILLAAVLGAAVPGAAADFPQIKGWSPATEVQTYTTDTLWEYINGAAEVFVQYGFRELETRELSADGVTVAVGIYDMGTPLNAFGIYRTEAPTDTPPEAVGGEAVVSPPYQALMAKDRYYVKVDVYDGELDAASGKALLAAIARALPGSDDLPAEVRSLPTEGMIAGSVRYTREAFLGLAELQGCVSADYGEADDPYQVFRVLPPAGSDDDAVWKRLAGSWRTVADANAPVLAKKVPYRGLVGVMKGSSGIVGVTNCTTESELVQRLSSVAR
jgi:hypothetical protein